MLRPCTKSQELRLVSTEFYSNLFLIKMSKAFLFLFRIFVVSSGSKYQLMISWWISLVIMSTSNPVSHVHIPKILTGANQLAKPPPRGLDRIINRPTLSPLLEPEKTAEIWHQKAELGNVMKCSINIYACIHTHVYINILVCVHVAFF